jgi:Holliday junction resolvase
MSSRSKGNKNELRCQRELERDGFKVQRAGYRRFQQNDFFELFDVMAIKPNITLMVQIKSNQKPGKKVFDDIKEFAIAYKQFRCAIWCWVDRKGWRKWEVMNEEFINLE